ncbi:MAG TPA: adenylate/guanylate cyclase domain-containing protein [Candidatus Binatia bacterium]|jgi:predicted ATPase/class 3 adenylate cyclase|nr:adenylate/guanylate cyclase domain-containing protein [Candidatus Binatia bacterium]
MTFDEVLDQVRALLQQRGRVTYRSLKRRFALDDEYVEDLKGELIRAEGVAADEDGDVLVWTGAVPVPGSTFHVSGSPPPPPAAYTPPHLAERIRAEQAALEARGLPDGERKTITALFADLKGSTALIEGLDPEAARAIIDPALQLMMDAVHRYEGYVAQALGDGIFALFGAPLAHEDHPQRALYAALRLQEEMRRYADTLRAKGSPPLLMRVGINTGEVVVRSIRKDDLHADYVPVGHSTNLAARMEQLAAPGSILVTPYTQRLTDGYFAFKDLGKTQIKGVEEPLNVYEVLGAGPLRTRLQVSARRGLTRFIGRQGELEQLQRALDQAKTGHGRIVGVIGEPGLGKSRLFYEFKLTSQAGCLVLEAYSVSHGKASPYLPVIELLKGYFQIQLQDDERTRKEKIAGKVMILDRSLEDTLPYLFALLGVEEQPSPLQQMDPQIRRRRTFEALKKLFLRESLNQPLILIFEDLHWIDSETQGFLDTLSEGVASARILLLTNYRPEYRHEWGQKTYYTQLRLTPLGKEEAGELLNALLGPMVETLHTTSLHHLKQLILEKTEGTPFFMEEVVQELFEQGILVRDGVGARRAVSLPTDLHIPTTVQGVLAARIDRLAAAEKALLQHLAVIGREFSLSLVRQVVTQPEEELYRLLDALQRKEFLYEQPAFPDVEYLFKHALTQEVAYNSVLVERRRVLHEQVARAIERFYADRLDEHYSDLAHHYSRSGNTEKAIEYLQKAGQQAVQRSANAEAVNHLTTALELLKTLPETAERARQELVLQTTIGPTWMAVKGYAAPEVEQAYSRARALCQQMGETSQIFTVLRGLWTFYVVRAELRTARELGEQLLQLAQNAQDPALLLEAQHPLGETLYYLGEFTSAYAHLEQGIALYDPQQHRSHAFLYGTDTGVLFLSRAAHVLWMLGYPDQAVKKSQEALALAQELAHPNTLAAALVFASWFYQLCREGQRTKERAEAAITLSTEQGLPFWLAAGESYRGWSLAEEGQGEEGIARIRQGLAAYRATGAEVQSRIQSLVALAEVCGKVGQTEEGLSVLAEAMDVMNSREERWLEAELYRLKGELLLTQEVYRLQVVGYREKTEEAEQCFRKAIEIACKQQAKSLELRAAMSLSRLWQSQGKKKEAHEMLAEIYSWFTEGFDTKDLQDARVLLDELS